VLWLSAALAASVLIVVTGSLWHRIATRKGIGWQFIRFNVIVIVLLTTGLLALNNALSSQAATLLAGALGYAFGKSGTDE